MPEDLNLTKIIPVMAIILMMLHLIKPIGWPGLKRRKDFWKIAIVMIAAVLVAAVMHD
ncbi:MAG: hypothetical protein JWM58_2370 [Rhizobium sp.]|nr:hypothetical protein [Rhizobium sp.]